MNKGLAFFLSVLFMPFFVQANISQSQLPTDFAQTTTPPSAQATPVAAPPNKYQMAAPPNKHPQPNKYQQFANQQDPISGTLPGMDQAQTQRYLELLSKSDSGQITQREQQELGALYPAANPEETPEPEAPGEGGLSDEAEETPESEAPGEGGLSDGAIAGIAIGGAAGLVLTGLGIAAAIFGIYKFVQRKKNKQLIEAKKKQAELYEKADLAQAINDHLAQKPADANVQSVLRMQLEMLNSDMDALAQQLHDAKTEIAQLNQVSAELYDIRQGIIDTVKKIENQNPTAEDIEALRRQVERLEGVLPEDSPLARELGVNFSRLKKQTSHALKNFDAAKAEYQRLQDPDGQAFQEKYSALKNAYDRRKAESASQYSRIPTPRGTTGSGSFSQGLLRPIDRARPIDRPRPSTAPVSGDTHQAQRKDSANSHHSRSFRRRSY